MSAGGPQGLGAVWAIRGMGDLEVNYCRLLSVGATDRARHGLQMGFVPQIH